ncbi:MAG: sodium-dependent bicarbonate transport family permease, partial [Gemmatimonadota bacterium]|nr:sodium-dependent bicarbonate transport family permease [Gemmatimonadota bacterium]
RGSWGEVLHEVLAGRSILLLLGGLAIGYLSGKPGLAKVSPFFVELFQGALTLFLLEMGMVAARRFGDLRRVGVFLLAFGMVMPVLHGALGVSLGALAGLSVGGSTVLGVMAASASYIAAPAAVRIALPQANPGYYLTAALAITFPFNLTVGIPLYHAIAQWVQNGG